MKISEINLELVKVSSTEDEKEPEQTMKKVFKILDFAKQSETVQVKGLADAQKYRARGFYQHSLGLVGEVGDWKVLVGCLFWLVVGWLTNQNV